jgi:hypothetical protein
MQFDALKDMINGEGRRHGEEMKKSRSPVSVYPVSFVVTTLSPLKVRHGSISHRNRNIFDRLFVFLFPISHDFSRSS